MTMFELQDHARGEQVSARKLKRTNDAVRELQQGVRPPRQVIPAPRPKAAVAGEPGAIRRFIYTGVMGADHLVCTDPLAEERTEVMIAKPWLLRESSVPPGEPRNGISYTYPSHVIRRASRVGGLSQYQRVIPSYQIDDVIFAIQCNDTDVTITSEDSEPQDVVWLDVNVDSRMWARTHL